MTLRVGATILAATLVVGGAISTVGAAPRGAAEADDTVVVASGELPSSSTTAPEADLVLFAWPANEVLSDLAVGEQINLDPIAVADIANDGSFSVAVDAAEDLERYASEFGEVNLFVSATSGSEEFSESFSVALPEVLEAEATGEAVVDLGELDESEPGGASIDGVRNASTYTEKSCATTKIENLGNKWIPIGGLFSTNPGATIDFQYSSGQSTSLGVAVSDKSASAGFSAGGTVAVSSTSTIDFPTLVGTGRKLAKTQFRFGKFETRCLVIHGAFVQNYYSYAIRADLWVGGTSTTTVSAPSATYCASYLKGSAYTQDKQRQVTWTGTTSFYGVGISAQTGWSTKGKLAIKFPSAAGKVCGSGGYVTESTAYQVVVK